MRRSSLAHDAEPSGRPGGTTTARSLPALRYALTATKDLRMINQIHVNRGYEPSTSTPFRLPQSNPPGPRCCLAPECESQGSGEWAPCRRPETFSIRTAALASPAVSAGVGGAGLANSAQGGVDAVELRDSASGMFGLVGAHARCRSDRRPGSPGGTWRPASPRVRSRGGRHPPVVRHASEGPRLTPGRSRTFTGSLTAGGSCKESLS